MAFVKGFSNHVRNGDAESRTSNGVITYPSPIFPILGIMLFSVICR